MPSALGSKGLLDLFSAKPEKPTEFTEERARSSLTEPPPGYQTPSAAQPYGLGPARRAPAKPSTVTERAVGNE